MSDLERDGKTELIAGIGTDAKTEADTMLSGAKQFVAERLAACESKLAEIKTEADEKLAKQNEEIYKSFQSSTAVEKRRLSLKVREKIIGDVAAKVKIYLENMVTKSGYKEIISGWILEAAIGLNTNEATVNASQSELPLIDQKMLTAVEKKITELSGKSVKLKLAQDTPLVGQGVVLTSIDKRTAFNNQVQTRLLRYQSEIRKMIYDTLFKE